MRKTEWQGTQNTAPQTYKHSLAIKKKKKSFFTEYTEHSSKVAQLQSVSSKIKPLTAEEEEEEEEKSQTSAPGQKEES